MTEETCKPPATPEDAPPFRCAVSADLVRRALLVADDGNENRYYLRGVHISPCDQGGAYVVATNGASLVCFHDKDAEVTGEGIINPNAAIRAALTTDRGEKLPRVVFASSSRVYVAALPRDSTVLSEQTKDVIAAQYREPTMAAAYPDWRKILLPIAPDGVLPWLAARKLAPLAKALNTDKHNRGIALKSTGKADTAPVWVFGTMRNGFGIIAGLRDPTGWHHEVPAWAPAVATPAVPVVAEAAE